MRGFIVLSVEEVKHAHLMPKAGIVLFDLEDRGVERASRQLLRWCTKDNVRKVSIEVDTIGRKLYPAQLDPTKLETLTVEHWTGPLS